MPSKQSLTAIVHLSRYQDYVLFVLVNSFFGLLVSPIVTTSSIVPFFTVVVANMLAVCFSFMINDIEDAQDDALNPDKVTRNPIAAGRLTKRRGWFVCFVIAIASLGLYSLLSPVVFILGVATLVLGWLYSWKKIRLKNIPLIDVLSHCLMLGGLLFLTAYFTVTPKYTFQLQWFLPFVVICIISCYGELFNEVRDLHYDKQAGLRHSAVYLGKSQTTRLMYVLLFLATIVSLFCIVFSIIPIWLVFSIFCSTCLLLLPTLVKTGSFIEFQVQEAVMKSIAISLTVWGLVRFV